MSTGHEIVDRTATALREALVRRELSAREVVEAHLRQIERHNRSVNAVVTRIDERALDEANALDDQLANGAPPGPLHGLPVAHKDLQPTAGVRTTYGSTLFADHVPQADSLLVSRLRGAGAISVGKTNTPEFGTGSQTYNALFGITRNPYDLTRTAGGSSGGSAAALAARMVPLADGTDMGGSLRNPASYCNVVGFRPSAGLVPGDPTSTAWNVLPVQGPMARTVDDVCLMLRAIAGHSATSPLAWPVEGSTFLDGLRDDVRDWKVGWIPRPGGLPFDRGIVEALERDACPRIEADLRCSVEPVDIDFTGADEAFRTLRAWHFAISFGAIVAEDRDALNEDLVWNVERGRAVTADELASAEILRSALHERMRAYFERYDVLVMPVSQPLPFPAEEPWVRSIEGTEMHTYLDWMRSAYYISVTGLPAAAVPCSFVDGLPVGLQIVGPPAGDRRVLEFARAFERVTQTGSVRPGEQPGAPASSLEL